VKEELAFRVPQFLLKIGFQGVGPGGILPGSTLVAGQAGDLLNGAGVGPQVTVERRAIAGSAADNVLRLPAGGVQFHAVVVARLPEQANLRHEVRLFPFFIVLLQVREQVRDKVPVGVDEMDGPGSVSEPATVAAGLGTGRAEPVASIVAGKARVT